MRNRPTIGLNGRVVGPVQRRVYLRFHFVVCWQFQDSMDSHARMTFLAEPIIKRLKLYNSIPIYVLHSDKGLLREPSEFIFPQASDKGLRRGPSEAFVLTTCRNKLLQYAAATVKLNPRKNKKGICPR